MMGDVDVINEQRVMIEGLRILVGEAAAHMARHAPNSAPFDQPLWTRMNAAAIGWYAKKPRPQSRGQ